MIKRFFHIFSFFISAHVLVGCSTNAATGQNQFTAFMSPQQENQIGAQEHEKIMKQYGLYKDQNMQNYVNNVGSKVVQYTERKDVQYKFFLLDSPIVNAFALPGGYIYLTRGLMALSNSEAEMAAVLAHEAGHITGRHSAERYSRGIATSLGVSILSAVIDSSGISQALGVGSDLFLKSYSREQENESDSLGIRYLSRSGYAPMAMSGFLKSLQADSALEAKIAKAEASPVNTFFSTHPATGERVSKTVSEARQYANQGIVNRDEYMRMIDGMVFGDSAAQGFVRGQSFLHPEMGFKFSVPEGYKLINQPSQIIAKGPSGGAIIFDFAGNKNQYSPIRFLNDVWLKGQPGEGTENITINGMKAATTSLQGNANGQVVNLRLVAIQWSANQIVRFQIILPKNASSAHLNALKSSTYSFDKLTNKEKQSLKPYRIKIVTSRSGDSVSSMARRMAQDDYKEERFRVLNGLGARDGVIANRQYKIIVE